MARKLLALVLLLIASSGCVGQPWQQRDRLDSLLPSDRAQHPAPAPGFLPSGYASPRSQVAAPPHGNQGPGAPLANQPLAGSESPRQQQPAQSVPSAVSANLPPTMPPNATPTSVVPPAAVNSTSTSNTTGAELPAATWPQVQLLAQAITAALAHHGPASEIGSSGTPSLEIANINSVAAPNTTLAAPLDDQVAAATSSAAATPRAARSSPSDGGQPDGHAPVPGGDVLQTSHTAPIPGQWRDEATTALAALERELTMGSLKPVERARLNANARLLHAILNDSDKALAPIKEASEDEQEFWKHFTHGLMYSLDADEKNTSTRRSALALRSLRKALDHLANISTLDVRNLAICSKVVSYGRFEEFKSYGFKPGQEVLLYVEIDNFAVESKADHHETELQGEYTIFDAEGRRIANAVLPLDKQVSKNRRHDYFIPYRVFMPKKIDEGHYTLQLTVEDVKGSKSNQASVEFWIR